MFRFLVNPFPVKAEISRYAKYTRPQKCIKNIPARHNVQESLLLCGSILSGKLLRPKQKINGLLLKEFKIVEWYSTKWVCQSYMAVILCFMGEGSNVGDD